MRTKRRGGSALLIPHGVREEFEGGLDEDVLDEDLDMDEEWDDEEDWDDDDDWDEDDDDDAEEDELLDDDDDDWDD